MKGQRKEETEISHLQSIKAPLSLTTEVTKRSNVTWPNKQ